MAERQREPKVETVDAEELEIYVPDEKKGTAAGFFIRKAQEKGKLSPEDAKDVMSIIEKVTSSLKMAGETAVGKAEIPSKEPEYYIDAILAILKGPQPPDSIQRVRSMIGEVVTQLIFSLYAAERAGKWSEATTKGFDEALRSLMDWRVPQTRKRRFSFLRADKNVPVEAPFDWTTFQKLLTDIFIQIKVMLGTWQIQSET